MTQAERALTLFNGGMTWAEVAEAMGISHASAKNSGTYWRHREQRCRDVRERYARDPDLRAKKRIARATAARPHHGDHAMTPAPLQSLSSGAQHCHTWLYDQYEPATAADYQEADRRLGWRTASDRMEELRDAGLALEVGKDGRMRRQWVAMEEEAR